MKKRKSWRKEEFEEVEYRPMSVKEILTEMKDISEVIIDLAYSALIFDSRDMAEEVRKLEYKMDKLKYQIRMMAMIATRTTKDAEQLSGILQVASAAENISNAAGDIVNLLETPIETRPFLPFVLKGADEKIGRLTLLDKSSMTGKTIGELSVETETGMRIIAIKRDIKWIYNPEDNVRLMKGDVLIVRGVEDGYKRLKNFVKGIKRWPTTTTRGGGE